MNYLLYQAYGKQDIVNEAVYSILSLFRIIPSLPADFKIVVYTDRPAEFEKIFGLHPGIIYISINDEQVKTWRGQIDFVHRVKIEILRDFVLTHEGNILYIDSDTTFLQDPLPLFDLITQGKLLMHICEGRIDSGINPIFKKVNRFIKRNSFKMEDDNMLSIPPTAFMWNAGVLGFSSSKKMLLEQVLKLTDEMYAKYPKHVMEQFAFSWFFQEQQPIIPTDNIIYHYWDFKEFRANIAEFIEINKGREIHELAILAERIAPDKLPRPPKKKRSIGSILLSAIKRKH